MERILTALKCDTFARCSKNVWLSSSAVIFVIMINYQAWVIPSWAVVLIACIILCYSLLSLLGYAYWLIGMWRVMGVGAKAAKSFYWFFLGAINCLALCFLWKVKHHF